MNIPISISDIICNNRSLRAQREEEEEEEEDEDEERLEWSMSSEGGQIQQEEEAQ